MPEHRGTRTQPAHHPPERGSAPSSADAQTWPSERKLRLFACGCCRQWWGALAPACRHAVETAERYADGNCPVDELEGAWRNCRRAEEDGITAAGGVRTTEYVHRVAAAVFTLTDAQTVATDLRPWRGDSIDNVEVDARCEHIRADVFGGPAQPVALDPAWFTTPVLALARTMYEAREFGAMPILADALQDAGCNFEEVLAHCRDTQLAHVRGCWVLDLLLGKR